jgi:hypothetical protein
MAEKEITATGPNGEKVVLRDGQWVPMPAAPRGLPSRPTPEAAAQDKRIRQGLRTAGGTFVANMLSIPHGAGELLAAGAAIPETVAGSAAAAFRREPMNIGDRFAAARTKQENSLPASALLAIPDPTTEDVLAVPGAISRSFSNANANARRARALWSDPSAQVDPIKTPQIGPTFAESLAEEKRRSEANPIATSAGRVGGDVATMLALRPGERATNALGLNPRAEAAGARAVLSRGVARSAEAGIDGAVLAALGDGDPVKTAAYSAGIQAGGSVALAAKSALLRNPVKSALGLYLGHEMFKAIAPGPQDLFESKDAAVQELVGAYVAGTAAGMLGASRGAGTGNIRAITDVMSSASRATIASVITQLQEAERSGNDTPARVLELMSANPDHFGADVRTRIEQAAGSEEPQALINEIKKLMESESFRSALEDADAPSQPEPPKQGFADWLMRR